jgi:NTE family protein
MSDLDGFLGDVPVLRRLSEADRAQLATLAFERRVRAGDVVLRQGAYNASLLFVRGGELAVRVARPGGTLTVAHLHPPAVFGEISFVTGRTCSADVVVVIDGTIVELPRSAVAAVPGLGERLAATLIDIIATRLHEVVASGPHDETRPVVLLRHAPGWPARRAFAEGLAQSLSRQFGVDTVLAWLGADVDRDPRPSTVGARTSVAHVAWPASTHDVRELIARRLAEWRPHAGAIVLASSTPADEAAWAAAIEPFATVQGYAIGPGDSASDVAAPHFIVQDARAPTLAALSGRQQLAPDAALAEAAHREGRPLPAGFARTVDSIARHIAGAQVGVAFGGGGAWGWAHVGVLDVLDRAGVPVDVVAGCSMGSFIAALRATGQSIEAMTAIAEFWRTRARRLVEWRVWRLCLTNERRLMAELRGIFGDTPLNRACVPCWANALDIETGREYIFRDGAMVDVVRAAMAFPGSLPPFVRGSQLLIDAAIMNPVPVSLTREMGCRYAIGINAIGPLAARKLPRHFPMQAIEYVSRCLRIAGHEAGQYRAESSADAVLVPDLGDTTMTSLARCHEIIEAGRRVAREHLPVIQAGYARLTTRALAGVTPANA